MRAAGSNSGADVFTLARMSFTCNCYPASERDCEILLSSPSVQRGLHMKF
jgi:hypothetical protein